MEQSFAQGLYDNKRYVTEFVTSFYESMYLLDHIKISYSLLTYFKKIPEMNF